MNAPLFLMAKKAYRKCVPFTAVLELTYRCNFRCSMCYVIHENTEGELTTEEWKGVLDQLAEAGTLYLELTGGEIFVRRDIWDILAHAEKRKFLVILFTNGSYISPEKAERLKQFKNIVGFSVSLYGGDKATFDRVTHVKGAYEKVTSALGVLRDHGFRVKTKTPITTENMHTIEGMKGIAKSAACFQYVCAPLITPRDDGGLDPVKDRVPDEEIRSLYRNESMDFYDTKGVSWSSPACTAGRSLVGISPQGDVYPCIQLKKTSGNLREKSFKALWESHEFDEVRSFSFGKMEKCQSCSVATFCSPCIGLNLLENGDIHKPSTETCRITTLAAEVYREHKRLPMAKPGGGAREIAHCALG
jgi:radical SAM protein with 4Fe4S-binding SPASM domain